MPHSHLPPLHTRRYTHPARHPCPVKLRPSALDVQTRLASDTSYPRVPSSRHACRHSCHDAEKDLPSNDPSIRAAKPRLSRQADSDGYGGGRRGPGAHSHVEDVALVAEIALGQRGELLEEGARQHRGRQSPGQVSPHCRSHQRPPEDPCAALQVLHARPRRPPSSSAHPLGHRLALHPGRRHRLPFGRMRAARRSLP